MLLWILIIAASVILDQVSKLLVVSNMEYNQSIVLIKNIFSLHYIHNEGAAFGMLQDQRWIFLIISSVTIVAMAVYLWKSRRDSKLLCIALSMIIGGGIGNMIDRCLLGYVIDFLDFTLINFAVFNVADSFVCIGVGLFILELIFEMKKEIENGKNKADADN